MSTTPREPTRDVPAVEPLGGDAASTNALTNSELSNAEQAGIEDGKESDATLVDDPGFAPNEPTDGRQRGEWKTRYPDRPAQRAIFIEAGYVFFVHTLCLALIAITAVGWPQAWLGLTNGEW